MDVPFIITSDGHLVLPVGFKFLPSDKDLVEFFLKKKVFGQPFLEVIREFDVFKTQPSLLPAGGRVSCGIRYFFSNTKRHLFGDMEDIAAGSGYWRKEGKSKGIAVSGTNQLIGVRNTLVFWEGKGKFGTKTNWIMHEFRLAHRATASSPFLVADWAVYRIFQWKNMKGEEFDEEPSNSNNIETPEDAKPGVIDTSVESGGGSASGPSSPSS